MPFRSSPGTSNRARAAGHDRVLHAFACRMSASRRKKGRKTPTFLVKDYLRKQEASSVEEYPGWSRGKAKGLMPSTTYDRSILVLIVTRSRSNVIFFFFFCHFLTKLSSILLSSWEWCSYSENQNAAALLQSLLRRTQHCRFPPSGFAWLSRFTIARTADKCTPQGKLCSSLNFCGLWKHRSRFFRMRRKDSDWAALSSLMTQVLTGRHCGGDVPSSVCVFCSI